MALLFLSPISLLSVTSLILNDFGAYYSATAAMKSTTRQNDSKEREGILETTTNGSVVAVANCFTTLHIIDHDTRIISR